MMILVRLFYSYSYGAFSPDDSSSAPSEDPSVLSALIECKAEVSARSRSGVTASFLARSAGQAGGLRPGSDSGGFKGSHFGPMLPVA